jgi:hypothetical protein
MKNQIGFFLSVLFSSMLLLFMILYFLYVNVLQPATLTGVATIQLTGLEYRSANGYLNSLIKFEGIEVPVIDIYAGYLENKYLRSIILNQTMNDVIYYLNESSTILFFDFDGNVIGLCSYQTEIPYDIYINGKNQTIEVCPPTLLLIYYYNITCSQG